MLNPTIMKDAGYDRSHSSEGTFSFAPTLITPAKLNEL
jgi:hypothetical protein